VRYRRETSAGSPESGENAALSSSMQLESAALADLRTRLVQGADALKMRIEQGCHAIELAPDLAQDIGSKRWFRGLGTMLGLSLVAVSFWPDLTAVEAATAMPVDQPVRDEFRSQMIMPLALGADSGHRMGATPLVRPLGSAPERPTVQMVATLGQGDSFPRMLQRAGVGSGDVARVAQMVTQAVSLGDIEPGTQFDMVLGRRTAAQQARPLDKLEFRARFDLDLAISRQNGTLVLERQPIAVDATPLRIRGKVGSAGLYRSARAAGAPLKAIEQYLRAIDEHVSIESDLSPQDTFDIVIGYKRSARGERQVGELLYAGLETGAKPRLQLLRWGRDGMFYEASGIGRQTSSYFQPVAGRLSSRFGMRRHPILGYRRMHAGIDYAASYGSAIVAVSDGLVSYAGRHGGHGKYVRIEHGGGLGSGYAHMSNIAVSPGTRVRAGQVIGYVGSTGLSTGPHLHFEVYRGGSKIDPMSVRFVSRPSVTGTELAEFRSRLKSLKQVPVGEALKDMRRASAPAVQPNREIDRLAQSVDRTGTVRLAALR
jgi:murein DD-endopeptidase MepM/ murein hydrolase activator NlpD